MIIYKHIIVYINLKMQKCLKHHVSRSMREMRKNSRSDRASTPLPARGLLAFNQALLCVCEDSNDGF